MPELKNIKVVIVLTRLFVQLYKAMFYLVSKGFIFRVRWYFRDIRWKAVLSEFGDNSHICPHVVIHDPDNVSIGSFVSIAEFVHMWGAGGITIGNNVLIASHVAIVTQTHDANIPKHQGSVIKGEVVLEDDVWLGAGVVVLQGIRIGRCSVIGAGSVVTRDVPPYSIMTGVPARKRRDIGSKVGSSA